MDSDNYITGAFWHVVDNRMWCVDLLAALPVKQRRAVELYAQGYTQVQIAEEMEISQQRVSILLKKAFWYCRGVVETSSLCVLSLIEAEI